MRVAHVISSPSGVGGAERVMLQLVQAGAERGWEQRVLHPFESGGRAGLAELCPPGTYLGYPCSRGRDLPGVWIWLQRILRSFKPHILHVHLFHALVMIASMPRPTGSRLVLTHHHGSRYVDEHQPIREWLDRICGRRYDAVVAVSAATREMLVERYGYPESMLWTIENGWSGEPLPRNGAYGHRIISVANFRAQKGHDVLLKAFAEVARWVPDASLVLVGDGPLRLDLEREAQALGIGGSVLFVGPVADVWPYLAEADIFALASRYEPMGIAVLEAMAAGLPVVATRVGGLEGLVTPGLNGQLVTPNNPDALAVELVRLLKSPELCAAMGAAAQERAVAHRAETMINQYGELYRQLARTSVGTFTGP